MRSARGVQRTLRSALQAVIASRLYMALSRLVDLILAAGLRVSRVRVSELRYAATVMTTVGGGNIGDQAMLEAVIANTPGRLYIVVPRLDAFTVPQRDQSRVVIHVLPTLGGGWPIGRIRQRVTLGRLILKSRAFLVIGADIMDGTYDLREALLRFDLLRFAVILGAQASVMGFSWSGHAHGRAVRAAKVLADRVDLCVRDPHSANRMSADGVGRLREVADVVFSLVPTVIAEGAVHEWIRTQRMREKKVVVINVSGLLDHRFGITQKMGELVTSVRSAGHAVLLLPHVIRSGDDDLAASRKLPLPVGGEDLFVIEHLLSPSEVASITQEADVVVTGRMHLAIIAIGAGTPAIVMSSQGKVSGLLERVGTPELEIDPQSDFVPILQSLIDEVTVSSRYRSIVANATVRLREMSSHNFELFGSTEDKPRLLLVTPFSALRAHDHAASDIAMPLLKALTAHWRVEVYAADAPNEFVVTSNGITFHPAAQARPVRKWSRVLGYPIRLRSGWQRGHTSRVRRLARQIHPDVIHVEYLQPAEVLMRVRRAGARLGITMHDHLSTVIRDEARRTRGLEKYYRRYEAWRIERVERRVVRTAEVVLTMSMKDAEAMRAIGATTVQSLRLGVEMPAASWVPKARRTGAQSVIFAGAMWRLPNELAAAFIVEKVMPLVWRSAPDTRLRIVGARPTRAVLSLAADPRVEVAGEVEDLDSAYLDADVVLSPSMVQAGVLLKVLRPMSMGCPVIVNGFSGAPVEGLSGGRNVLVADSEDEMAGAVLRLLSDASLSMRLGAAARTLMATKYGWSQCARTYHVAYRRRDRLSASMPAFGRSVESADIHVEP